jgi:hypothetical protein
MDLPTHDIYGMKNAIAFPNGKVINAVLLRRRFAIGAIRPNLTN